MTYTATSAVAAVNARSQLIGANLDDTTVKTILAEYTTSTTTDGVTTTTYDITGCAIACLRSLIGTIPTQRSIGGISYTNESITAAIAALSKGRGGMVSCYRASPLDEEETQL